MDPVSIIIAVFAIVNIIRFGSAGLMNWAVAYVALLAVTIGGMLFFPHTGRYVALGLWVVLLAIRMLKAPVK